MPTTRCWREGLNAGKDSPHIQPLILRTPARRFGHVPICRWRAGLLTDSFFSLWLVTVEALYPQPLVLYERDIPLERTISSSSRKMSGTRGSITAFAWLLVSGPCQTLEPGLAVLTLAADYPSLGLPSNSPDFLPAFTRQGAWIKPGW